MNTSPDETQARETRLRDFGIACFKQTSQEIDTEKGERDQILQFIVVVADGVGGLAFVIGQKRA